MNFRNNKSTILLLIFTIAIQTSCKKFLDARPDPSQVVPGTVNDLQLLLNENLVMNAYGTDLSEIVADNYYLTTEGWQSLWDKDGRTNYIWDKDATYITSWRSPYQQPIYVSNIVLDQLSNIKVSAKEIIQYNNVKGSALFFRAFYFQMLSDLYCRPYSTSASSDPGIVLRLTSDINVPSTRSTVQETYDRILGDLKEAVTLLPDTGIVATRPGKAAAYGAIARTYLSMREYAKAGLYADSCLRIKKNLINYNTLVPAGFPPISSLNNETVFYNTAILLSAPYSPTAKIDSTLYKSYDANDLRKELFFEDLGDGSVGFRGSYGGTEYPGYIFDGIAIDEMYLIRAECYARAGNKEAALADLNTLLQKRWVTGQFNPITAADANEAKTIILTERRKELLFRGLRWSDLRRLNLEGANITLTRVIDGITYTLPPKDPRWVMLIPREVISQTNLAQNPR